MAVEEKRQWYALYLRREPASLVLLFGLAIVSFTFVSALSRLYYAQQASLASRWSGRGIEDLNARRFASAVEELRAALRYSRGNPVYQLNLAEALIGLNRTEEAQAYLVNLLSVQPENGQVNLELARVAAARGLTPQAIRYYHNAIYGNWPDDQEASIRDARFELIAYLLRIKAKPQAQSELVSLAVYLGEDPAHQRQLGDLFVQTGDYEHALSAYRLGLRDDARNPALLAGAANAAFEEGNYMLAERYLFQVTALAPKDTKSREQLKLTQLVLRMDPYRPQMTIAARDEAIELNFALAGERLKTCPMAASYVSSFDPRQNLAQDWARLKPQVTARGLRNNPDLVNESMNTAFAIEHQASIWCGTPSDADRALQLVMALHEGS